MLTNQLLLERTYPVCRIQPKFHIITNLPKHLRLQDTCIPFYRPSLPIRQMRSILLLHNRFRLRDTLLPLLSHTLPTHNKSAISETNHQRLARQQLHHQPKVHLVTKLPKHLHLQDNCLPFYCPSFPTRQMLSILLLHQRYLLRDTLLHLLSHALMTHYDSANYKTNH